MHPRNTRTLRRLDRQRFRIIPRLLPLFGDGELGAAISVSERGDVSKVRDALRRVIAERYSQQLI